MIGNAGTKKRTHEGIQKDEAEAVAMLNLLRTTPRVLNQADPAEAKASRTSSSCHGPFASDFTPPMLDDIPIDTNTSALEHESAKTQDVVTDLQLWNGILRFARVRMLKPC